LLAWSNCSCCASACEFAVALAIEQVDEAVIVLRNKNRDARPVIAPADHPIHAELVGNRTKGAVKVLQVESEAVEVPFDAGQVVTLLAGLVLLEMEDVAIIAVDKFGDGRVEALTVGTLHQQDRTVFHGSLLYVAQIVAEGKGILPRNKARATQERTRKQEGRAANPALSTAF